MKALIMAALVALAAVIPSPAALTPCATEDQETACYWDASQRGNGLGQSFRVTDSGDVVFTEGK